jgi:hypothetical protein
VNKCKNGKIKKRNLKVVGDGQVKGHYYAVYGLLGLKFKGSMEKAVEI